MHTFSREAAHNFAQQQIQQKRIERIKAVREKEKLIAKKQALQYTEFQQASQRQVEDELRQMWQMNNDNKLQKLKHHYNNLQSSIGIGHESAHQNICHTEKIAFQQRDRWSQQQTLQQQRAKMATSKLQQKIINEQKEKEIRAQWRQKAVKMAQAHRKRLEQQLKHHLPHGLSPHLPLNNKHAMLINNHNKNNNKHSRCQRYTLVTSHRANRNGTELKLSDFNPHPTIYFEKIKDQENEKNHQEIIKEHKNLREYIPQKLLARLNRKYNKTRKKSKRKKKKELKFRAAGIRLKSDGSAMLPIPENQTLSSLEEQNKSIARPEKTMFHSVPSHIQQYQQKHSMQVAAKKYEINNWSNMSPWDQAGCIRAAQAELQRRKTKQFIKAQERGKIALEKETQKIKSKQLDCQLELMHQNMIREKLDKCKNINDNIKNAKSLQTELEEKFEDLFQSQRSSEQKEECAENDKEQHQNAVDVDDEESKSPNDEDMKPRMHPPAPVSYSSSVSPVKPEKKALIIPSGPSTNISSPTNEEREEDNSSVMTPPHLPSDESEEEVEENCLSITRSRRVKICKGANGSTSISESTSMSTSISASPQKPMKEDNEEKDSEDKVVVPKKWFESLLRQIKNEEIDLDATITSQTVTADIKKHGNDQVSINRTWFEQMLRGVYNKNEEEEADKENKNETVNLRKSVNLESENDDQNERESALNSIKVINSSTLSRDTTTNSLKSNSSTSSPFQPSNKQNSDEFNLIFKRKKPISILSEMMSDMDSEENNANDADDETEYDPNTKPNNLRTSIDSDISANDEQSMSPINIDQTSKFIRESAALLNKTANFFENFSEDSSMDYTNTDKSFRKMDIDKMLRSSINSVTSDSSQWSLSSLSSMEFNKLPDTLHKFEQFLSIGNNDDNNANEEIKKTNAGSTKIKTPMQTIKEIPTPSSCSDFTVQSKPDQSTTNNDLANLSTKRMSSSWRDKPNTPKLFDQIKKSSIVQSTNNQKVIKSDHHSDEEKASTTTSQITAGKEPENETKPNAQRTNDDTTLLTKDHFITPSNTTSKPATSNTDPSNPRFTDGTLNSYPSLPPSVNKNKSNICDTKTDQSALPIQHLDFRDIHVSASNTDNEEQTANEKANASLMELKKFNEEMDNTLQGILKMNITDGSINGNDSFIKSMQSEEQHDINPVLDSINVSEIEASKSNPSIADAMEKLSNLSTASFSLSTFRDHGPFEDSDATNGKFTYSEIIKSDAAINGTGTTKKFPPLTPQDLMHNLNIEHEVVDDAGDDSSSDKTLPIGDDSDRDSMEDMELEDLTAGDDGQRLQLQRQQAKYIELESSSCSATNDTTKANGKFSSVGTASMSMSIPFRFNYDHESTNSADENENGMSLGDLETVKEEQSKSDYALFVGLDSDQTSDVSKSSSVNMSLQEAFKGFKSSNSSNTASSITHTRRAINERVKLQKRRISKFKLKNGWKS